MKVFVYESVWENGEKVEGGVAVRLFANKDNAIKVLNADAEQAIEIMINHYDVEDVNVSHTDTQIEIEANYFADCWTGMVYEKEVE